MNALWMLGASFFFAAMGVCIKLAGQQFPPAELVFYRGVIAALLVFGYVRSRGFTLATPHWRSHLARSFAGFISLVSYFYAIQMIPLATAVTLGYTSPLFLALILTFWKKEKAGLRIALALVAGFLGVTLVLQPTFGRDQFLGGFLGLVSGVVSSIAYMNVRRLGELGEPEWRTVFYFSSFTALGGLVMAATGGTPHSADAAGWLLVVGVGTFGALGQLCMTAAYKRGKTLVAANLAYSTVVFAALWGILLWDEWLSVGAWMGMALIVGSGITASTDVRSAPAEQD